MGAIATLAAKERGETVVDSGLAYGDGEPVEILVRKRLHRYLLTDRGRAVAKGGKPDGWREVAERAAQPMERRPQRDGVRGGGRGLTSVRSSSGSPMRARAVHEALLVLHD